MLSSLLLVAGCASTPTVAALEQAARSLPQRGLPPHVDARETFRATFCAQVAARARDPAHEASSCADLLWRIDGAPPAAVPLPAPPVSARDRVYVVSGAFGDCRFGDLTPFREAMAELSRQGVHIEPALVSGRSGSAHNARQLAGILRAATFADDDRIVLVGYSKGTVDILQFLVDEPELARRVAAVVSVSGPVYGSPLAENAAGPYRAMFERSFESRCDPGDGGVLESLRPDTRRRWLQAHPLPRDVRYFSLAAFTTSEHLSRALRPAWSWLAQSDPLNDGQVVARDAIIPGSTLLGYVNADHWDLALTLDGPLHALAHRSSPRVFPRAALLEALLLTVDAALNADDERHARGGARS